MIWRRWPERKESALPKSCAQRLEEHLQARKPQVSCLELAERIEVVGIYKDAPSDLSTNPIYMEGFGE